MSQVFTEEELREAMRAARIYSPAFDEDKLECLIELAKRIDEAGFLDTVEGLSRLAKQGISCTQALDACEDLIEESRKLKEVISGLKKHQQTLTDLVKQSGDRLQVINKEVAAAKQELAVVKGVNKKEAKSLEEQKRQYEADKKQIEAELEKHLELANLSKEEVAVAGEIKAEAEGRGIDLRFVLEVAKELAIRENVKEVLTEAFKEHGSLLKHIEHLEVRAKERKAELSSEIESLKQQKQALEVDRRGLQSYVSQLRFDVETEESLRRFYERYQAVSGLIEYVANWNQVYFMRCDHPFFKFTGAFDRKSGGARFWTDKPPTMCPECGHRHLAYDLIAYQTLNCPAGQPIKLELG